MADLKKKFIDILFDDEEDDNSTEEIFNNRVKTDESPIRAKDILYRRSSKNTFINLNEPIKKKTVVEDKPTINNGVVDDDYSYEMSTHISPIFGPVKENKKKDVNVSQDIIDTQTTRPADSHLDIVPSPIYGYSSKEDAQKNNYDVKGIDESTDEEQELHELFDDDDNKENDNVDYYHNSFEDVRNNNDVDIEDTDEINLFKLFGENQ